MSGKMCYDVHVISAGMAKSADARDLKSLGVTSVPVQVRLPAETPRHHVSGLKFFSDDKNLTSGMLFQERLYDNAIIL